MRDSSCLSMIPSLIKKGAKINYYDPTGKKNIFKKFKNVNFSSNIRSAIKDSDMIISTQAHPHSGGTPPHPLEPRSRPLAPSAFGTRRRCH